MDEQAKIEEARAAGYTDEEIQEYLATKDQPVTPQQPMNRSEEYAGLAQGAGANLMGNAIEYGLQYGVPAAGAYYGIKKAAEMFRGPVAPAQAVQAAQAAQATQTAVPQRQTVNAPATNTNNSIKFPSVGPAAPNTNNSIKFPSVGPAAPNTTPTTPSMPQAVSPQQQSMMQRGMQYADKIKQIAMEKVMQNAGTISNVAKGGVAAAATLTPGNIGQNYPVPRQGPYKGMEINPMTNRPWTQQELAQINR